MGQSQKENQNNNSQIGRSNLIPMNKVILFTLLALCLGFIGGIKFGDTANKKLIAPTGTNMVMPPKESMGMDGMTSPGPVNIDKNQAIQKMESMLKSDPKNMQILIHLGNLYYDTNEPQKAVNTYEKALSLDKKNPDVLTDCAQMYRLLKNKDKALAYLKEATGISSTHYQSWFNLGLVYRDDFNQPQNAISTWNQILTKIPDSPHAAQIREELEKTKKM